MALLPLFTDLPSLPPPQDSVEPREIASGQTAQQLALELGVSSLPGYVMTVNSIIVASEPSSSSALRLRDGDLVQVRLLFQPLEDPLP